MYFDALDNILGNRPATEPMVVIDSLSGKSELDDESNVSESDQDGKEEQEVELRENDVKESEGRESSSSTVTDNWCKEKNRVDVKSIVSNKKKQKHQLEVVQDTMKGVFKEVIDAQKASYKCS